MSRRQRTTSAEHLARPYDRTFHYSQSIQDTAFWSESVFPPLGLGLRCKFTQNLTGSIAEARQRYDTNTLHGQ